MKCANCGAEIKVGCIYCSVCGKEAQIVSDYNLLEDDFLRNMLQEREENIRKKAAGEALKKQQPQESHPKNIDGQNGKAGKQKRKVKKRVVFAVVSIILLVVLIVVIVLMVNHSKENSYDYQMEQARAYVRDMNYRAAQESVNRALELDGDSLEAKLLLADIYVLRGDEDKALALFEEICREHTDNKEAYVKLIGLYDSKKDYESILKLSEEAEEGMGGLFSEYLPGTPEFDTEEGVYTEEFYVGISVEEGNAIYYTLDGTDPRQGMEYQAPILVGPGETVKIRAVARNGYELYGDEIAGEFETEPEKPEKPRVSPSGGSFYDAQEITVTVPVGCKVYYTWDGTTPDTSAAQYTQPIAMPEGNNILSLVAVNQYGLHSDVLKCNYIYMPVVQNTAGQE